MSSFKFIVALSVSVISSVGLAGDFIDTRVTFAFAQDNVFMKPGEGLVNSPGVGFGATRANTQFFDNFNTRFSGFETLSNLTLYKRSPSFFEGFDAEAALSVVLTAQPSGEFRLFDNSSYVKLNFRPPGWGEKEEISLTGFPVSSDRFRLGYNWRITWAGDSAFTYNQGGGVSSSGRPAAVPGGKLQVTRDRWYAFVGLKTGTLVDNIIQVPVRTYGGLIGGGVDLYRGNGRALRLEANGGYFGRGNVPSLATQGIRAPVTATGASARLSFSQGDEIQSSIDMRLYKNDPDILTRFFRPETYPGGLSIQLQVEGSYLAQTLVDPDRFATTKIQPANAFALQARFKYDYWRFSAIGLYRSMSFILFDVPSVTPYEDFPSGSVVTGEAWLALGVDRFFPTSHITLGLVGGVQRPASSKAPTTVFGGNNPPANLEGPRTTVIYDVGTTPNVLPSNAEVWPVVSIKGTFKIDISEYFALIGELFYARDANQVTFRDSTASVATPTFIQPNRLGFNAVMQARF